MKFVEREEKKITRSTGRTRRATEEGFHWKRIREKETIVFSAFPDTLSKIGFPVRASASLPNPTSLARKPIEGFLVNSLPPFTAGKFIAIAITIGAVSVGMTRWGGILAKEGRVG